MIALEKILDKCTILQNIINAKRPFSIEQLPQLQKFYKPELTWSSNALEGNSIGFSETQFIIEHGITIHGHTLNEIAECTGGSDAIDEMFNKIHEHKITHEYVKNLHYLFAKNIKGLPCPGEYRNVSKTDVYITGSEYSCPTFDRVPKLMDELIDWVNEMRGSFHPVELAGEFHRRFVTIHPFPDGNGRVARLLMNTILLQESYMPVVIKPTRRKTYVARLEDSRISPTGFDIFIAEREFEQQKRFAKLLNLTIPKEIFTSKKRR